MTPTLIDLDALETANASSDGLSERELDALVRAVRAAQHVAGFGWDAPHHPGKNAAMGALDDALTPFQKES